MDTSEFLIELLAGSILLLGCGYLIGHLLKLNKFSDDWEKNKDFQMRKMEGFTDEPDDLSRIKSSNSGK